MAVQPMDAVTSFVYLTENIPIWIGQLDLLSAYAAQKNAEYAAEYARLVKQITPRPKRIRSPSLNSIRPDSEDSIEVPAIQNHDQVSLPATPDTLEIDPLEAGNKYLYAQAQRKRKPGTSIRSGASGPQKFRSKRQVVIYYDTHLQERLDSMVKAIGIARNNLRKGKNALTATTGFQLPSLGRRYDNSTLTSSLENLRSPAISRSSAILSGNKYSLSSVQRQPSNKDEAAFINTDKSLESVQSLCETAAHQFLRDGDCKSEIDSSITQFKDILERAQAMAENLRQKAQKEGESAAKTQALNVRDAPGVTDRISAHSETTLYSELSVKPWDAVNTKLAPTINAPTSNDYTVRPTFKATAHNMANIASLPTAGVEIEVDDASDQSEIEIEISKYRIGNVARLRAMR